MMNDASAQSDSRGLPIGRLLVLLLFAALFGVGYFQFADYLSLDYLSSKESELRAFWQERPIFVFTMAFLIYVVVTGLSLPGGAITLTLACAWIFGFWKAILLVSFASTCGATIAFLLSRYLLHDAIQRRYGDRLVRFNRALQQEGAFYLFTLRIIPAVPFFAINVAMGLTPIRVGTYYWVSQIGMLPGTCVYVFAGSQIPSAARLADEGVQGAFTMPILIAFVLLGAFPLLAKKIMARFRTDSPLDSETP